MLDTSVAAARWTLQDLESKRLSAIQLATERAMKGYQRGKPSDTLFVKNLAPRVKLADLIAVFGAVLPPDAVPEYDVHPRFVSNGNWSNIMFHRIIDHAAPWTSGILL